MLCIKEEIGMVKDNKTTTLDERKEHLKNRRERLQVMHYCILLVASVFIVVIPIFMWRLTLSSITISVLIVYMVVPISLLSVTRNKLRDIEQELKEVEFDIDLQQYQIGTAETRAEKILRINDFQLQRYYNVNLSQNMWVFGLGVFCILLGIIVIAGTLYTVLKFADSLEAKIIIGVLGAIGSLLTSYIAAIYLKMHAAASQHLGTFHSRLVETHQTLLANLVASRIEDQKLREDTLSKLSLGMGTSK